MYILGISSYAHESSCCLIQDGKVLSLIEEERLNREKHTWKFPSKAIHECLKASRLSISDIDHITFFWRPIKEIIGNLGHFSRHFPESVNLLNAPSGGEGLSFLSRLHLMMTIAEAIRWEFGKWKEDKVHFIEHHLCHAASCFFISPFEEAAILTVDGRGEANTSIFAKGVKTTIQKLGEVKVPHSLGHLYAAVTDYLGFTPFFDEWKVMGMSAYGNDSFCEAFDDLVTLLDDGKFRLDLKYFKFHTHGSKQWVSGAFIKRFGAPRQKGADYEQRHFNIAYALQRLIEKTGVHMANALYEKTKSSRLCMTGGVVLNCLMNMEIVRQTPFKEFFIQPIASDAGTSLGSALYYYHQILGQPRRYVFNNIYLGPDFSDEEIEETLIRHKLKYKKCSNIARETAEHIAKGKIIGWFQGRMEAGPRALGNRSITVDPTDPTMKERLNARVKKREFFRPFAPSVLEEKVEEYFEMPKGQISPYMILTGMVKPEKRAVIPAVTHADNTARVQTVSKEQNPKYWQLIKEFEEIKGVPVLLNTSFNENEPIVCTPEDAVRCFLRTDFDILAIGNFLVDKSQI